MDANSLVDKFSKLTLSKPRFTYKKYLSQIDKTIKYFKVYNERDLSFVQEANQSIKSSLNYCKSQTRDSLEMAAQEEDDESGDEVIKESVIQVINDLNITLWDQIHQEY